MPPSCWEHVPPRASPRDLTTDVLLSARGLSKSYGPFKAVDSVDLDIQEHDIHVFIGPNGAGKSTVLNMLGGQILPSAGEVFFRGRPLGATTPSWRCSRRPSPSRG